MDIEGSKEGKSPYLVDTIKVKAEDRKTKDKGASLVGNFQLPSLSRVRFTLPCQDEDGSWLLAGSLVNHWHIRLCVGERPTLRVLPKIK